MDVPCDACQANRTFRRAQAAVRRQPADRQGRGRCPVQAYIAAMPDWKRPIGAQLDALIEQAVPGVHKAVKWNSPMYAVAPGAGWFLSFHCFTRYIKVAFFRGAALKPVPPEPSRSADTRYLHIAAGWRAG
jgi:hypothetical protein